MKKVASVIFGLLIVIVVAYLIVMNLPKASVKNKEADFRLSATELYEAFETDEKKANKQYIGKTMVVKGRVVSVEEDDKGSPVLILDGGGDMGGVLCTFEGDTKLQIQPGEEATVKGLCTGVLMDVVLNKCVLLEE